MKKLMLFLMWVGASAGAVGVAWSGVSVVDNQIVDPPSAAEFASPTTAPGVASTEPAGPDTQSSPTSVEIAPTTPTTQATSEPSNSSLSNTSPTSQSTPRTSLAQNSQAASTTTPSTQPTATPAPVQAAAMTQTFTLTGGTAAISFSSSGVEILWATPNPGFEVSIEPESPGIKVEFRSDVHRSRVDAWWSGGPQNSIREEPRG